MSSKSVSWKAWASTQVSIALLQERVRLLQIDIHYLKVQSVNQAGRRETTPQVSIDAPTHQAQLPPPQQQMDWKWLVQMMVIIVTIAFVVLANTNEQMATEILKTIQSVAKQ